MGQGGFPSTGVKTSNGRSTGKQGTESQRLGNWTRKAVAGFGAGTGCQDKPTCREVCGDKWRPDENRVKRTDTPLRSHPGYRVAARNSPGILAG
jgi:hypothetical protein